MSADDFREIVARLRSWGFRITETSGCYSRSNGLGYARGVPCGHINHHFVCSLNPAQSYIDSLVQGLMNGRTVPWFADVNGNGYLVGVGPMNHAGTGNSSVLARTLADLAPLGPATAAGDMTGNTFYSGTELQHPGDSTPYPPAMVDLMVAISAAEAMQWGWSAGRIINHFEWTGRKIDMSWAGGRGNGSAAGGQMRQAVAARMAGPKPDPQPTKEWFEMPLDPQAKNEITTIVRESIISILRSDEFRRAAVDDLLARPIRVEPDMENEHTIWEIFSEWNRRLVELTDGPK